jgi:hypothetical protein
MSNVYEEETFRPMFGRVLAGCIMAICAATGLSIATDSWRAVLNGWPWLLLVGGGAWSLYWHPCVVVTPAGVRVVNIFRTFDVSWPAITDIDTRWALELRTASGDIRAWAAPAPGPSFVRRMTRGDSRVPGRRSNETVRPGDSPLSDSGAAALIVRQRWDKLRNAGHLDSPVIERPEPIVTVHRSLIASTAAVAIACVLTVIL